MIVHTLILQLPWSALNTAEPAWPDGARDPRAHRTSRCATPELAVAQPGIVGRRRANIGQEVGDNNHG